MKSQDPHKKKEKTPPVPQRPDFDLEQEPEEFIKENSSYISGGKCAPDNNPFWEDGHNPLSSKGN